MHFFESIFSSLSTCRQARNLLYVPFCLMVLSCAALKAQVPFDMSKIPAPLFRCPIYDGAADPAVQWNSETNEWWLFYTQRRANVPSSPGVAYCYGTAIGIAVSDNNGESWYYRGTANLPQLDEGHNSFWAPDVFKDKDTYYMVVTYIKGIHSDWGGVRNMLYYKSKDLMNWEFIEKIENTRNCIDGQVLKMKDGTWKMWYKNEPAGSETYSAISKDLKTWKTTNMSEIKTEKGHEGPIVFEWKGKYWNIIDECTDMYAGLYCYESADGTHWTYNSTLLDTPGLRKDDFDQGRHCDVVVIEDRAFMFYFTHPGRTYKADGNEDTSNTDNIEYRRSSIQMVELEYKDGKIVCDRNKFFKKK